MLLYQITRPVSRFTFRFFFKKLYFSFPERIPRDTPVMLAVNHPTAFLDPCVLASFLPMPLFFLTRGDIFSKPFYRMLLRQYHMIPIYRFRDGFADMKQNHKTFRSCYQAWSEGKAIVIFSEGSCIMEKRLRPIQKGTARMAFGAWETYPDLDLHIVPVGVNYTYPDQFRTEAMFTFGHPIRVADYRELFASHPVKAVNQLTQEISSRLGEKVVIIDQEADEDLTEDLLVLYRNANATKILPVVSPADDRLRTEIAIARRVNAMDEDDKEALRRRIASYRAMLQSHRLDDIGVVQAPRSIWLSALMLIAGAPFFVAGSLGNWLPGLLATRVTQRKVKHVEFYASVLWGLGSVFYLLYYIIIFIALSSLENYIIGCIVILSLPLLGFYTLHYREYYRKWLAASRFDRLPSGVQKEIRRMRSGIME